MSTTTESLADLEAVIESAVTGRPLDPEIGRRVDERSDKARQETLRTHGTVQVAVNLIRCGREE